MGIIRGMRDAGIGGYASSAELLIPLEGEMNASASKKSEGPLGAVSAGTSPFLQ